MTEPQTITTDHVRSLLEADEGGAILGLIEGRVEVIDSAQLGTDEYAGALEVITRDELRERVGDEPTDEALNAEAAALSMAAHQLGG
jgi:NADH dehydrogenase